MEYLLPLLGDVLRHAGGGSHPRHPGSMPMRPNLPMPPLDIGPVRMPWYPLDPSMPGPPQMPNIGPVKGDPWWPDHETKARDWGVKEEEPMDFDLPTGPQKRPRDPEETKTPEDPPPPKKPKEMPGLVMPKAIQSGNIIFCNTS